VPKKLYPPMPEAFRPYALDIAWDRDRLWALDLPVTEVPVADLAWQLALPWWRDGEHFFALAPLDALDHPEHGRRVREADLAFPLDVTPRHGRLFVLDGVHRLFKATLLGVETVQIRILPPEQLASIAA
jgi:hypothetical protein